MKYKVEMIVDAEQWNAGKKIDGVWGEEVNYKGESIAHIVTGRGLETVYETDWIVIDSVGSKSVVDHEHFEMFFKPIND